MNFVLCMIGEPIMFRVLCESQLESQWWFLFSVMCEHMCECENNVVLEIHKCSCAEFLWVDGVLPAEAAQSDICFSPGR